MGCRQYDSSADRMDYADISTHSPATNDMTVMVWAKTSDIGSNYICGKGGSSDWEWALRQVSSGIQTNAYSWISSGATHLTVGASKSGTDDGNWHFMAGKWNEIRILQEAFRDDVTGSSSSYVANTMTNRTEGLEIGRRADTSGYWGTGGDGRSSHCVVFSALLPSLTTMVGLAHGVNPIACGFADDMESWEPAVVDGNSWDWSGNGRFATDSTVNFIQDDGAPVELVEKYM